MEWKDVEKGKQRSVSGEEKGGVYELEKAQKKFFSQTKNFRVFSPPFFPLH